MNKKDLLAKIISKSNTLSLMGSVNALLSDSLIILAYHRIYDMGDEDKFPFDPELVSATPEEFEIQIKYVKKYFNVVSFKDVINHIDGKKSLPKRPVIITFDDGHYDNYSNAFPVLKSLKVPATIFLSTGYIGTDDIFWFDWVTYLIYRTKKTSFSLENDVVFNIENSIVSRREVTEQVLEFLKSVPNASRLEIINNMSNELDVTLLESDKSLSSCLNWEQVVEMSSSGIDFGSHTITHPILSRLESSDLLNEIIQSKCDIEKHLDIDINTIAYPVGGNSEYNNNVINICKSAGYRLGISYVAGVEKTSSINLFEIKRLHVERYTNMHRFKAMLHLPQIFM